MGRFEGRADRSHRRVLPGKAEDAAAAQGTRHRQTFAIDFTSVAIRAATSTNDTTEMSVVSTHRQCKPIIAGAPGSERNDMSAAIRTATLADLPQIVELLMEDAESRRAHDPTLWA